MPGDIKIFESSLLRDAIHDSKTCLITGMAKIGSSARQFKDDTAYCVAW